MEVNIVERELAAAPLRERAPQQLQRREHARRLGDASVVPRHADDDGEDGEDDEARVESLGRRAEEVAAVGGGAAGGGDVVGEEAGHRVLHLVERRAAVRAEGHVEAKEHVYRQVDGEYDAVEQRLGGRSGLESAEQVGAVDEERD